MKRDTFTALGALCFAATFLFFLVDRGIDDIFQERLARTGLDSTTAEVDETTVSRARLVVQLSQ